ncbi:hypothetical protein AB0395_04820 [Streptosporangium sp. NPDC051023]|uniref:hypothetical protein n=1 Tax=Streptosporangium sp. NPDC051023 TaxID=3155410 RepID=UPI003450C98D
MKAVKTKLVVTALAACLSLAACGGSSSAQDSPSATATGGSASQASSPDPATGGSSQVTKVSANTASEAEIAGALGAAGVPNPERWAREVVEYRPYAADDPDLTSLRQNLAKYNPGEETVNKIVSALTP